MLILKYAIQALRLVLLSPYLYVLGFFRVPKWTAQFGRKFVEQHFSIGVGEEKRSYSEEEIGHAGRTFGFLGLVGYVIITVFLIIAFNSMLN